MRHDALLLLVVTALLGACSSGQPSAYQGYVEGEYVHVASPVDGPARAARRAARADGRGRTRRCSSSRRSRRPRRSCRPTSSSRRPRRSSPISGSASAIPRSRWTGRSSRRRSAAEEQAAQQLQRDEAQFAIGGIARAQLDDSRANHAIKARACASSRASCRCRGCRRAKSRSARRKRRSPRRALPSAQAAWRLDQKRVAATQAGLVSRHALPRRRVGARRQPGRAHAAAEEREGALLRSRGRRRRPQARDAASACTATAAAPTWPRR